MCHLIRTVLLTLALGMVAQAQTTAFASAVLCARVAPTTPRVTVTLNVAVGVTVDVQVPATTLADICLCEDLSTGLLTSQSSTNLNAQITSFSGLGLSGNTATAALQVLSASAVAQINQQKATCNYPTNAVSTCTATKCSFTCSGTAAQCNCPTGTTLSTTSGQNVCAANAVVTGRKRAVDLHARSLGACKVGQTACGVPGNARRRTIAREGYECLDLQVNLESCGGCKFPFAGQRQGEDCTEIGHVDAVACINSRCVIQSCRRGYTRSLDGSACVELPTSSSSRLLLQN